MPTRVFFHCIQALNLICKDDAQPKPLATIECFETDHQTPKMKERTYSPFWDYNCVFLSEMQNLGDSTLVVKVYNSDSWIKNQILGEYTFELAAINEMPTHEYYRQWCVLTSPEDETECVGWLKCSITVLLDGQDGPQHSLEEQENPFADEGTDDVESLQDAILKPPKLRSEGFLLHVDVFQAWDLPKVDFFGTIDPVISVKFATGKEVCVCVRVCVPPCACLDSVCVSACRQSWTRTHVCCSLASHCVVLLCLDHCISHTHTSMHGDTHQKSWGGGHNHESRLAQTNQQAPKIGPPAR